MVQHNERGNSAYSCKCMSIAENKVMAKNVERFLYHGTWVDGINTLEPRQAYNGDSPDGDPAVFATNDIDYAIFMALIGTNSWGGWDSKKYSGRGFYLYEEFLEYLTRRRQPIDGHVYFLDADDFTESRGQIFRTSRPVRALGSVAVGIHDLPSDITILPEPHPYYLRTS